MNAAFVALIDKLKDPSEQWVQTEYTLDHRAAGLSIWTANVAVINTNLYPSPLPLSLWQRWILWQAVKVARWNAFGRQVRQAA